MHCERPHSRHDSDQAKLVIVCLEADQSAVAEAISDHAPLNWAAHSDVRLIAAHERQKYSKEERNGASVVRYTNVSEIAQTLARIAPPQRGARIVTVGPIALPAPIGQHGDSRALTQIATPAELDRQLPHILQQSQLDWRSFVEAQCAHYHLAPADEECVDRRRIDRWLVQFRNLELEWIGVALLKLLDFWPTRRVCQNLLHVPRSSGSLALPVFRQWVSSYTHLAVGTLGGSESSMLIRRLVGKAIGAELSARMVELDRHLINSTEPSRILFFEDSLMTGTEIIKLLDLVGNEHLSRHEIDLRFAFATAAGKARLGGYMYSRKLTGIRVLEPAEGFLPNVSALGKEAVKKGTFLKSQGRQEFASPSSHIVDGLTLRSGRHYNHSQRKKILKFCRAIGEPLMKLHFERKGWPASKIASLLPEFALGPSNLGLLTVFAHGVSKPVIPLFWAGGEIDVKLPFHRKRFRGHWEPLFPSAD